MILNIYVAVDREVQMAELCIPKPKFHLHLTLPVQSAYAVGGVPLALTSVLSNDPEFVTRPFFCCFVSVAQ